MSMKNPLTPAGIEPATFRFVAQHLNHCATAVHYNGDPNCYGTDIPRDSTLMKVSCNLFGSRISKKPTLTKVQN